MSMWLSRTLERAAAVSDWLGPQRAAALAQLRATAWPGRRTEDWRYVNLNPLAKVDLASVVPQPAPQPAAIAGLDAIELVFVDGVLDAARSTAALPAGLTITPFRDASGAEQAAIGALFGSVKPARHFFGLVNDTLATDGLLIDVAPGAAIAAPVRVLNLISAGAEVHTRLLVNIGAGARVCVIEQHGGADLSVNTGFAEYAVGAGATLEHYRLALQTGAAMSFGGSHFALQAGAELTSNLVGFGSQLARLDVDVIHAGEHARANLNAIYLLDGSELFDLHSCIEHAVPFGTTTENVRGIVADRARAVFNGRIHIHRHAQKTVAELNNRNLLMSADAEINTKPELEIYADDVRCAHGATVAELDKKAMYYLLSRGISRSQAQVMLSFGFINELVDQMPNQALADWLRPQLRARFAGMEVK